MSSIYQIEASNSLRRFANRMTPLNLFGQPARTGLGGKTKHVKNVMRIGMMLPREEELNPVLLQIALQLHDIGRSVQWAEKGSFYDGAINHRYIALQMVEKWLREENTQVSQDWVVCMDVMQYHGVMQYMRNAVHDFAMPYVEIVSKADDIENGCCGALGYLEDEKARDDKHFIQANPERDQRDLNPELLGKLERGEKFDKMVWCHTYAEYFVFAATLAVKSCLESGEVAKEAMRDLCYCYEDEAGIIHWLDAVEGYCHIFERHLQPDAAKRACEIMRAKCR